MNQNMIHGIGSIRSGLNGNDQLYDDLLGDQALDIDHFHIPPLSIPTKPITNLISKYQDRSSPPFRIGGRGSKQLAKALEQNKLLPQQNWVLCTGSQACFAQNLGASSQHSDRVMIQPMNPSAADPCILIPWVGQIWLAKKSTLISVQMKQEALTGGFRLISTPLIIDWVAKLNLRGSSFSYPISLQEAKSNGNENWDTVSLEDSEYESVDSLLFTNLKNDKTSHSAASLNIPLPKSALKSTSNCSVLGVSQKETIGTLERDAVTVPSRDKPSIKFNTNLKDGSSPSRSKNLNLNAAVCHLQVLQFENKTCSSFTSPPNIREISLESEENFSDKASSKASQSSVTEGSKWNFYSDNEREGNFPTIAGGSRKINSPSILESCSEACKSNISSKTPPETNALSTANINLHGDSQISSISAALSVFQSTLEQYEDKSIADLNHILDVPSRSFSHNPVDEVTNELKDIIDLEFAPAHEVQLAPYVVTTPLCSITGTTSTTGATNHSHFSIETPPTWRSPSPLTLFDNNLPSSSSSNDNQIDFLSQDAQYVFRNKTYPKYLGNGDWSALLNKSIAAEESWTSDGNSCSADNASEYSICIPPVSFSQFEVLQTPLDSFCEDSIDHNASMRRKRRRDPQTLPSCFVKVEEKGAIDACVGTEFCEKSEEVDETKKRCHNNAKSLRERSGEEEAVLPPRHVSSRSTRNRNPSSDFANRNSVFGSFFSGKQSAANGAWKHY